MKTSVGHCACSFAQALPTQTLPSGLYGWGAVAHVQAFGLKAPAIVDRRFTTPQPPADFPLVFIRRTGVKNARFIKKHREGVVAAGSGGGPIILRPDTGAADGRILWGMAQPPSGMQTGGP